MKMTGLVGENAGMVMKKKREKEKTRTIAVLPLRAAVDRAELCERQVRDILPDVGIVGIARRLWSGGGRGYSS